MRHLVRSAALLLWSVGAYAGAQEPDVPEVLRALELENTSNFREAGALLRSIVVRAPTPTAVLAFERVYAELRWTDSLVAPLDTIVQRSPREPVYRSIQLRTLQSLGRPEPLQQAFESWARAMPRDPGPYREYARLLLQAGRASAADSVIARGVAATGDGRDMAYETAQLRAARGEWTASATAWTLALGGAPHLASAAAYALAPAPSAVRDSLRATLGAPTAPLGARQALAELELAWGNPDAAWASLAGLAADTSAAAAWQEFGERMLAEERWSLARRALSAAFAVRSDPQLAEDAAQASLHAGSPAEVFRFLPLESMTSPTAALPLHVQALGMLGRAEEADQLVRRYDAQLAPAARRSLAELVAQAWVRRGDLTRARAALTVAGADADSSEAAGWIALYEGRLAAARTFLRASRDPSTRLALALSVIARVKGDDAPRIGEAFRAEATGDTAEAIAGLQAAAAVHPEVGAPLLLEAARWSGTFAQRQPLWQRIIAEFDEAPEAAEAELEWSRALRSAGDASAAREHLEHLILTWPQSALVPQARRELGLLPVTGGDQ